MMKKEPSNSNTRQGSPADIIQGERDTGGGEVNHSSKHSRRGGFPLHGKSIEDATAIRQIHLSKSFSLKNSTST